MPSGYPLPDLTSQKFNMLTVLKLSKKDKFGRSYYLCRCDCGNLKVILGSVIRSGDTKSCGCLIFKTRKRLDKILTKEYLEEVYVQGGKTTYQLAEEFQVNRKVINRYIKQHGIEHKNTKMIPKYGLIRLNDFKRWKQQADKRKLEFNLTIEYLNDLYLKQNGKCSITGLDIIITYTKWKTKKTASIDRIDSRKGYIIGNVQWVHKKANVIKAQMDIDELLSWCKLILLHNLNNIDNIINYPVEINDDCRIFKKLGKRK